MTTPTRFVVMSAAANMPPSCKGRYRRVAVVEVIDGVAPKMISSRARGVIRVVQTWEKLSVGITAACAYRRALAEANELAKRLNGVML